MLYFHLDTAGNVTEVTSSVTNEQRADSRWVSRHDFNTIIDAEMIAASATALTGETYVATDRPNQYPRFDVIRMPHVGDEVSYSFNGDTYPDGKVVKISASLKVVTTDTGSRYHRVKATGCWRKQGMWSLVRGHHNERNPEF